MEEKQPLRQPTSSSHVTVSSAQDSRWVKLWGDTSCSFSNIHRLTHTGFLFLKKCQFFCTRVVELNLKFKRFQGHLLRNSILEAAPLNTNYSGHLTQVQSQLFKILKKKNTILSMWVNISQTAAYKRLSPRGVLTSERPLDRKNKNPVDRFRGWFY